MGGRATVLIFSPHPDDECIIGGAALRLMRQAEMRVVNVAVTLGSKKDRQEGRYRELQGACAHLGWGLIQSVAGGLERISALTRQNEEGYWRGCVEVIAGVLHREQPRVILLPHAADNNSSHVGTHLLVMDALQTMPADFSCHLLETEYWGAMTGPNLMVEIGAVELADLIAALSFHIGELQRNPYHLSLPAWMMDNVRRGGELVGGQGAAAPDFAFATLYRLGRWRRGRAEKVFEGDQQVPATVNIGEFFV
jgi:LmbE family N-acetylglucosaminyl deacetylase